MNQISEYEARLRDQEWDKAEDRRLERKRYSIQLGEAVALIREARDLMREALDDVCGQLSPSDAEDWIMRAMDACSTSNPLPDGGK